MTNLVIHPLTEAKLLNYLARPSHALLLIGPRGMGKGSIAKYLASNLIATKVDTLADEPYVRYIVPGKEQSISIDAMRELEHFLALRVPGSKNRVVVIEDAHALTKEAQNALLKTLEEPPERTFLLLTTAQEQSLLPTIRSRVVTVHLQRPNLAAVQTHFSNLGYRAAAIRTSQLMSGGLPGLMAALLQNDQDHPLAAAAVTAREIIQKSTFERLAMIDQLAKQKQYCLDTLAIMQQMAHVALTGAKPASSWQRILRQSYVATEQLLGSGQPKLALTNLMLNL